MLGTGRDFRKLFSPRHFRQAAWSVANLENWPSAIVGGLWRKPVGQIRFRNGLRFQVDSQGEDLVPLFEVFSERVYERHFQDIAPDGTILDIGGNIGTFTVRAAKDLVPRGKVIVIEPNPKCLLSIEENLSLNNVANVQVIQAAVASGGARVALHISGSNGGSTLFSAKSGKPKGTLSVPALSGRDVLRLANAY
jgi:FkbM family methyltransferase